VGSGDNREWANPYRWIDGHLIYALPKMIHGPRRSSVSIVCQRENHVWFVLLIPAISRLFPGLHDHT